MGRKGKQRRAASEMKKANQAANAANRIKSNPVQPWQSGI